MKVILHAKIHELFDEQKVVIYDGEKTISEAFAYRTDAVSYLVRNGYKLCAIHGSGIDSEMWFTKES